ncbi:MAG: NIPSNAP family protein [Proteobacteria bacterium]|nr:NIPSNAP family protein [Pseudomonadota bacterium]
MIIDCRTYTLVARKLPEYLKIFGEHGLPVQKRHLGDPVGFYFTEIGPLNQIVHLWGYEDYADMERKRTARSADPAWKAYQEKTVGFVHSQETKILRPAPFFTPPRAPRGQYIDFRVYTLITARLRGWLGVFEKLALPVQRKYLGEPVGFYLADVGHVNTVTHLWAYESLADMEKKRAARNADPAWGEYLKNQGEAIIDQQTKILRPAPFFAAKG